MDSRSESWLVGRVFYTLIAAYYWAVSIYLDDLIVKIGELPNGKWYEEKIGVSTYGGRYKFLTHWNLITQRFYFSLACIAFLIKSNYLRSVSRFIYGALIIPSSILVTLMFWAIYSIDRDIIFPKFYDDIYPWWVNHSLHTYCSIIALADLLLVSKPAAQQLNWERLCLMAFAISYLVWLCWVKYTVRIWPYQFMYKLSEQQLAAFILANVVIFLLLHWLGVQLKRLRWGDSHVQSESEKTKSD